MEQADLVVIGGGVSCVAVLEQLVVAMRGVSPGRPLRLLVLDAAGEFGGGVPYGRSVPLGCLCNDPAGKQHPAEFTTWLRERREEWLGRLRGSRDTATRRWLALNATTLSAARRDPERYAGMFIPRPVYGDFVRERLAAALAAAEAGGALEIILRPARVTGIARTRPSGFQLELEGGEVVASWLVLLAIGSPPPRPEPALAGEPGYIRAPCTANLGGLEAVLIQASSAGPPAAVAILGGNACALEVMSLLDTRPTLRHRLTAVSCITSGDGLPDDASSGKVAAPAFARLSALGDGASLTADALFAAARVDVAAARADGSTVVDYADPLYARVVPLLARLRPEEQRRFAEAHGRRFKALARHTPPEYRRAAARLAAAGLLRLVRGTVSEVRPAEPGFRVRWHNSAGIEHTLAASIVLDCRGWGYLDEADDPFLASLLAPEAGLARANGSRLGVAVDGHFLASPGLFVMGPLLAGSNSPGRTIWNLENARRIFALAPALARSLAPQLVAPASA